MKAGKTGWYMVWYTETWKVAGVSKENAGGRELSEVKI